MTREVPYQTGEQAWGGGAESIFWSTSWNGTRYNANAARDWKAMDRSERHLLLSPLLHVVKPAIRCMEQGFDGCAVLRINRNANTHGKAEAPRDRWESVRIPASTASASLPLLSADDCKLVTAISRRRVNRSTGEA